MSVLFIDSSYDITLGLLNENLDWHDLRTFRGQRASSTLQVETHRLLSDFGIRMADLYSVVSISGPGFYTGLRLSEGFADVTSFFLIPHYSFYSYEVPGILGVESGSWMTKAYRGEYFFYNWNGSGVSSKLEATKGLEGLKLNQKVFIHSETSLDEKLKPLAEGAQTTLDLIRSHPHKVFQHVIENKLKRESFYFRAPEDEFRTAT